MTGGMEKTYPSAVLRLIKPGDNDPEIIVVGLVFHVDVGNALSLFNWFNGPSAGIESHLHLRKDGVFEQYRVFSREADAQTGGNSWLGPDGQRYGFISVETQGTALGYWTQAQKQSLKDLALWASKEFGFPLTQVKVAQPDSPAQGGIGYHSLFTLWNPLKKSCPGPRRINWFKEKFVPWMREQGRVYHVVTEADSILSICHQYGVTPTQLWRWNRDHLQPGEKLRVR